MGKKRADELKAITPPPRGQVRKDSGQFGTTYTKLMQYQPPAPGKYFNPISSNKSHYTPLLGSPSLPPSSYMPHLERPPQFPVVPLGAFPPPLQSENFPETYFPSMLAPSVPKSIYDSPGTGTSIGSIGGAFPSPINPKKLAPAIANPILGGDNGGGGTGGGKGGAGGIVPKIPGQLGSLFATLKTMGPQGAAFAAANMAFESFMKLIDKINPFKSVFESLGEIFEVYGAILEASMLPLIEALFEQMLAPEVLDSVEKLGKALGEFAVELIPFIPTFIQLGAALIDIAIAILPIVENNLPAIKMGLDLLTIALTAASVPITVVSDIFDAIYDSGVGTVMQDVGDIIDDIALLTFTGINDALEDFKEWLVDIETFLDNLKLPSFMTAATGSASGTQLEYDNAAAMALLGPVGGLIYGAIESANEKRIGGEAQIQINVYGNMTEEVALETQKELWLRNLK